jgi:hypothetical protein
MSLESSRSRPQTLPLSRLGKEEGYSDNRLDSMGSIDSDKPPGKEILAPMGSCVERLDSLAIGRLEFGDAGGWLTTLVPPPGPWVLTRLLTTVIVV